MTASTRLSRASKVPATASERARPPRAVLLQNVLTAAKRPACPLRKSFVQQGRGPSTVPGPLAALVSRGDERGLDAFLLAHAAASAAPWDCTWPSSTWVDLLNLKTGATEASAKAAVSKIFARLADRGLVKVGRVGRTSSIVLLKEDGSGDEYTRPTTRADPWFSLSHAYWTKGYDQSLSLPAKAMLLIALYTKEGNWLPAEHARAWFGISTSTARAGVKELCDVGLLVEARDYVEDPRSPTGWSVKVSYSYGADLAVPKAKPRRLRAVKATAPAATKTRRVKKTARKKTQE